MGRLAHVRIHSAFRGFRDAMGPTATGLRVRSIKYSISIPGSEPMVRFIIVESFLLGCLFLIAAYVFWQSFPTIPGVAMILGDGPGLRGPSPFGISPFVAVIAGFCLLPTILYWVLQWMGMTGRSFWMVTLVTIQPQFPAVLAHNQLDWALFWRAVKASPELSQTAVPGLAGVVAGAAAGGRIEKTSGTAGSLAAVAWGAGSNHCRRSCGPCRTGCLHVGCDLGAYVGGRRVRPHGQPAGLLSLDGVNRWRRSLVCHDGLFALLVAHAPTEVTRGKCRLTR